MEDSNLLDENLAAETPEEDDRGSVPGTAAVDWHAAPPAMSSPTGAPEAKPAPPEPLLGGTDEAPDLRQDLAADWQAPLDALRQDVADALGMIEQHIREIAAATRQAPPVGGTDAAHARIDKLEERLRGIVAQAERAIGTRLEPVPRGGEADQL